MGFCGSLCGNGHERRELKHVIDLAEHLPEMA